MTLRSAGVLLLGLLAAIGWSCGKEDSTPAYRIVDRWLEEPETLFGGSAISEERVAFDWSFETEEDLGPWRMDTAADRLEIANRRLHVRSSKRFRMIRTESIQAADLDVIELRLGGLRGARTVLEWRRMEGEKAVPGGRISISAREGMGRNPRTYRFEVAEDPEWRGEIVDLTLIPTTATEQDVSVWGLTGLGYELIPDRLTSAVGRSWKFEIEGEVRTCALGLPGIPQSRRVDLPTNARLRFGYGIPGSVRQPVTFRVEVTGTNGNVALFESTLEPEDATGWHEGTVDLSSLSGKEVEIQLSTSTPETLDPLSGIPVWAHPEVQALDREPRPPNVVLVSLDTLRADHMSLYGHSRPTTPLLDAWAGQRAVTFETVTVAAPWTLPSHVSMLSGLDALSHGVNYARPVPASLDLLAEHLRSAGYVTQGITEGGYLHPRFSLTQGFDRYRHEVPGVNYEDRMEAGMDRALAWLDDHADSAPFFLFFHTYEIHDPYVGRQPWYRQFGGAEETPPMVATRSIAEEEADGYRSRREHVLRVPGQADEVLPPGDAGIELVERLYDSSIAYADSQLHRLLEALDRLGVADDTLVVITSDHGEALGAHGFAGHGHLYDDNLLVPMVVAFPDGRGAGSRIDSPVRSVDILPTVLEVLGRDPDPGLDGRSLTALLDGSGAGFPQEAWTYNALSNHGTAVRVGQRWKYVFQDVPWPPTEIRDELYSPRDDEAEEVNLAHRPERRDDRNALLQRVSERLRSEKKGLRIDFRNGTDANVGGVLFGSFLKKNSVKTPDVKTPVLWKPGRIHFTIPAGQRYSLFVQDIVSDSVDLRLSTWSGSPAGHTFDLDDLAATPQGFAWSSDAFTPAPLAANGNLEGDTGLVFHWSGNRDVETADPSEEDVELRRRLEALGYIGG
ncbi:MAG: sulfatase [Acidobacteriota bacterium]